MLSFTTRRLPRACSSARRWLSSTSSEELVVGEQPPVWCVLSGFSPAAHRLDLQLVLDNLRPLAIDPLLDPNLYPNGSYALLMPSAQDVRLLQKHVGEKYPKRLHVQPSADLKALHKSSDFGISNKTVRIVGLHKKMKVKKVHLAYFLENYLLDRLPQTQTQSQQSSQTDTQTEIHTADDLPFEETLNIRTLTTIKSGLTHHFVDLQSEEEAERLAADKDGSMFEGTPVTFFHYQM